MLYYNKHIPLKPYKYYNIYFKKNSTTTNKLQNTIPYEIKVSEQDNILLLLLNNK
jgi:hypothetical protein